MKQSKPRLEQQSTPKNYFISTPSPHKWKSQASEMCGGRPHQNKAASPPRSAPARCLQACQRPPGQSQGTGFTMWPRSNSASELEALKGVCREWCTAVRRRHRALGPYWFPIPELVRFCIMEPGFTQDVNMSSSLSGLCSYNQPIGWLMTCRVADDAHYKCVLGRGVVFELIKVIDDNRA